MSRALPTVLVCFALAGCTLLPTAKARDALDLLQERIIRVSERVSPSVVHIEAAVKVNNRRNLVTGSGFLMDAKGIVLTNEHVVERAEKVSVVVPGRAGEYTAEVVGSDKQTDLAVLRIKPRSGEKPFTVAKLGDSEKLQVGEWVIAIGNPYGLDGTVSLGIISAKGRDLRSDNLLNDFIQTDAMIDRGSSGGPLINLEGEVVGINSRGQGRGIGFTIPIDTAKSVASDLLEEGRIARGYLGVAIQPLDRELAEYWGIPDVHGLIVNGVVTDSPAEAAGLLTGDIVMSFDGTNVKAEKDEDVGQFQRLVARTPVGKKVEIRLLREGQNEVISAKLDAQPKVVPDEEETEHGFTVQEVTARLLRLHRLETREGVLVSFVERGSEAAEASLAPGDLIQKVDDHPIVDIESFRSVMSSLPPDRPFLIQARRGEDVLFVLIVPRDQDHRAESGARAKTGGS
jgi:S1-C subfamily serine protease